MYREAKSTKPFSPKLTPKPAPKPAPKPKHSLHLRVLQKLGVYNKNKISIGLWHKFVKPPYGSKYFAQSNVPPLPSSLIPA